MKTLRSAVLFSCIFSTFFINAEQKLVTYKEIGDKLIGSLGVVTKQTEKLSKKEQLRALKDIPELEETEKLKLLFELLEAHGGAASLYDLPDAAHDGMRILLKELEVFYRDDATNMSDHLFSKIDHTQTIFGKAELARMIALPVDDVELLQARQKFIKELVANEKLFNQVSTLVSELKNRESDILSFWQELNEVSKKSIDALYLPYLTRLKKQAVVSSLWQGATKAARLYFVSRLGLFSALSSNSLYRLRKFLLTENPDAATKRRLVTGFADAQMRSQESFWRFGTLSSKNKKLLNDQRKLFENPQAIDGVYQAQKKMFFSGKDLSSMTPEQKQKAMKIGLGVGAGFLGVVAGVTGYLAINGAVQLINEHGVFRYIHTRLAGMATLVKVSRSLQMLMSSNPIVADGLLMKNIGMDALEQKAQENNELKKLIGFLESSTFDGDYSFFSRKGRILASFELMKHHKDSFAVLMQHVGKLDACLSIAKLYKESQKNTNAHCCFVEYLDQQKPYIKLDAFWNPMVGIQQIVTNSVELNADSGHRNMILTGSNTGGKSTTLKAIVINILFSRLGIAFAHQAAMTPFTYVATSLNISDNTGGGISLFNAEVLRARSIADNLKGLRADKHAFLAIDELFVGTSADKGSKAAYRFVDHISTFGNAIYVIATHFKAITELEKDMDGVCKNYKIDVIRQEDGTLQRPFKLEEGVSDINVANELLQQNMSDIDFMDGEIGPCVA